VKAWTLLPLLAMVGCASQASREALKQCRWEMASFTVTERSSSALRGTAKVRFTNPTAGEAILDSMWADVSTPGGPLARLSHGRTVALKAGASDSTEIHLQADPAQLGMRMMEMLFAAPDSLLVKGKARIPMMGGLFHVSRSFQAKVPGRMAMGALGGALQGGAPAAPEDTTDEGDLEE